MRVQELRICIYVAGISKVVWERVTTSRMTKFYFVLSVVNCIIQVALQAQAFSINAQAAAFLSTLIEQGDAVDPGFSVLTGHQLRFCDSVPKSLSPDSCQVVWDGATGNNSVTGGLASDMVSMSSNSSSTTPVPSSSSSNSVSSSTETVPVVSSSTASLSSSTISAAAQSSATSTVKQIVTRTVTTVVFASPSPTEQITSSSTVQQVAVTGTPSDHSKRDFGQISAVKANGTTEVTIDGFGWDNQKVTLQQSCLLALNWPVENMDDTTREDITFIAFQIWVLGMSFVALLNESVLHIIASLLMHVLVTAYGGFQISQTEAFHADFQGLITNGACSPINLLPTYWSTRGDAEIASVVLNAIALLLSAFMSWRLLKLFGWQTFKRIGASCKIKQIYMLVLSLSIAIQLSLFFIVASIALWIDQLDNGAIGQLGMQQTYWKAIFIVVILLLPPWLTLGWVAVRRELRIPMLIFLVLSFCYLVGWASMFASSLFRWTFIEWRFFSLMTSASVFLTLATLVLGMICFLNFHKGLKRYLLAHVPLDDEDDIDSIRDKRSSFDEKVAFPSMDDSVPTFSAAFGKGDEVPIPTLMFAAPPRLGPRFTNPSAEPFDPQPNALTRPSVVMTRSSTRSTSTSESSSYLSYGSTALQDPRQLSRQETSSTQRTDTRWTNEKFIEAYSYDRWSIE